MRLFKLRPMNQTHDDFDPNWKIYLSKHDQYECTNVDLISRNMPFSFERTLARLMAAPKDFFQKMGMLSPRSTKSAGKGQACLASANEAGVVIKWGAEIEPPTTTRSNVDASSESLEPSICTPALRGAQRWPIRRRGINEHMHTSRSLLSSPLAAQVSIRATGSWEARPYCDFWLR